MLALGARLVVTERAGARAEIQERLAARSREAAGEVGALAARLLAEAAAGRGSALVAPDGTFLEPQGPEPLAPLTLPAGRDPQGQFRLAQGELAERAGESEADALGWYEAAARPERDPLCRALARWRLAALHRRAGRADEAAEATRAFLAELPRECARTREALLARVLDGERSQSLQRELLRALTGSGSPGALGSADPIVLGMLADAGLDDAAALAQRRAELARIERLRPALPRAGDPDQGAALRGSRLVAWVRTADGGWSVAEGELPALDREVRLALPGEVPASADLLVETAAVDGLLGGTLAVAALPRAELEREARRRVRLFAAGLCVVLLGGVGAFWITLRAVRRESAAAAERQAFVDRVGHDLRTPLTVIRMYAETLAEERVGDPAEARRFAQTTREPPPGPDAGRRRRTGSCMVRWVSSSEP